MWMPATRRKHSLENLRYEIDLTNRDDDKLRGAVARHP